MERNTESEMDSVLFTQQRPQESHLNTPVAKKTRSSVRPKAEDGDVLSALPKSPNASTFTCLFNETPRRSARKSVRPPMDYEDIVENNVMRSASKQNKEVTADADAVEEENHTSQKWNVAEVGRISRKRGRKPKRTGSKRAKKEEQKCTMVVEEQQKNFTVEEEGEKQKIDLQETEKQEIATKEPGPHKTQKLDTENREAKTQELGPQKTDKLETETRESGPQETENQDSNPQEPQKAEPQEAAPQDTVQSCKENYIESTVAEIVLLSDSTEVADTAQAAATSVKSTSANARVVIEDMDELGLCPLTADEDDLPADGHIEEMPSLIMIDDGDQANDLNRTFEIDDNPMDSPFKAVEQQTEDKANQLDLEMPKLQMSPDKPIKIVLSNENNQDITLLTMDNSSKSSPSSKAYRFPTPLKTKSRMRFKFTADKVNQPLELNEPCRSHRRSKSVCLDKTKSVTFFSPIEVTAVNDIDKRWEKLNTSHVTHRRKRSMSLDNLIPKSRIPKPKFIPVIKAPTPVKLKARTKLPNFAAIHQKQFSKMENLVDHIERKAVRAKELTNSAKKLVNGNASAQKSSSQMLPASSLMAADRQRPRAQKKIALPSITLTPLKPEEIERQKKLPTPRKIIVSQPKSRLPLLAKPMTKIITSISKGPVPVLSSNTNNPPPAAPGRMQSKLEARRQRHMEMFKGRKAKDSKDDFIRGVRSNRRFQLQMEHRRQMNEKNDT